MLSGSYFENLFNMKLDRLNQWLTPLTNVAVLIGLILIIVELQQNQQSMELDRKLAMLDSTHMDISNLRDFRSKVIADPVLADLYIRGSNGEELTEVEKLRFVYMCQDLYWSAVLMHDRAFKLGMYEYSDATVAWIGRTLRRKGMKECWDYQKAGYVSWGYGEFVDAVDELAGDVSRQLP